MEYLEIYRDKLSSRINGTYDETAKVIRFEDGTEIPGDIPLSMVRQTPSIDVLKMPPPTGFDVTKHYSFASLALLIASTSAGTQLAQYINQARRMHIAHLPFIEGKGTVAFLRGELDECELLMNVLQSTDKISRSIKRKKIADLSATALVQLSQGAMAPNTSVSLSNSPINTADYMTLMKSIYNEALSTYASDVGQKRKADKIGGEKDAKEAAQAASLGTSTQLAPFKPEMPIIIVPAALSLTFNFKNLGDLFAHGKFIKSSEPDSAFAVQPESAGADKAQKRGPNDHHIKRLSRASVSRPGSIATFELCSDPETLTSSQWNRVVGVVVTGKAYQLEAFTPFKKGDEVNTPNLFEAIAGLYLFVDGEQIPPSIKQWNVSQHKFSQSKRHLDEVVMSEVWERIVQFCKQRQRTNPNLFF